MRVLVMLAVVSALAGCGVRTGTGTTSAECDTDCDVGCSGAACLDEVGPATDVPLTDSDEPPLDDGVNLPDDGPPLDTVTGTDEGKPAEDIPYNCHVYNTCPSGDGAEILYVGNGGSFRVQGIVVTPTGAIEGEVLVVGDKIVCVGECEGHAQAGGAWVISTHGVIFPGLIDTHNHILFDVFDNDDWVPEIPENCGTAADCASGSSYCAKGACVCVDGRCRYTNHDQWPKEDGYALMLDYKQCLEGASQGRPDWCPVKFGEDGDVKCELQKWGELKGLIAGTTSIVGLPGTASKCVGSHARSIDVAQNGLGVDSIQTSALFPPSKSSGDGVCKNVGEAETKAYLVHVGEGTDETARAEFDTLISLTTTDGCLLNEATAITHGTAFGAAEFAKMAENGMKLTWSPASNVALYGSTTNIPEARAAGVLVSLAPDWSMGGSQNLLDELRFADAWDNAHWGDVLTPQDLFEMVTSNAAKVVALEDRIGAVEVGLVADLFVATLGSGDPHVALLESTPATVRLVMVGGVPIFGDAHLLAIAPATPGCDTVSFCGVPKFLCTASDSSADKLGQTYADIEGALSTAFDELDTIPTADLSFCGACKTDEECFEYVVKPKAEPGQCPSACAAGESCIHAAKSGATQYKCEPDYTCSPRKTQKKFLPVAPLVRCPGQ